MRHALLFVLVAACGSSSDSEPVAPDDHKLHNLSSESGEGSRIAWAGKGVSIADIPIVADRLGLPVSGTADVSIYLDVPKDNGRRDWSRAKGTAAISCTKCQIGDDKAKLKLKKLEFMGDGIDFGHVTIDGLEAKAVIGGGKLDLTIWRLESPDLELQLALSMDIAATGMRESQTKACIRFKPTTALQKRAPKTFDILSLTGANRDDDGYFTIEVSGRGSDLRYLPRKCTMPAR